MNAPQPLHFHSPRTDGDLARRLRQAVGGDVLFDAAARGRYATDASIYQVQPVGVLVPASDADVRAAFDVCRELRIPMLPRGAGSSQCGQTVGAALVIDHSKHLNKVVAFDADARTVTVEPGIVLDALNAWLKPHGLWFPVDVSTSAQCTLGGMAGNNSCGSRSIAYGNMVHNVAAIDALLADGTAARFGPEADMQGAAPRVQALVEGLRAIGARERDEIAARVPSVLRRVGGYNIDVFNPVSERPYTRDGSVNYAHLLVGSEGTLAWTRALTLDLAPIPRHRTLGVVNFPTLYRAMECARHIVGLGPSAVELVDRTMIDLARGNPAFRPVIDAALIGEPDAVLLVEFVGEDAGAPVKRLADLAALLGDLGLPGSVVPMTDAGAQKALWDVRKAGLNIMMSMRGDGKPVSFIEDCAVPLEHLADYVDQLTTVFRKHGTRGTWYAHASVGTLHVRPILDMRRDGAAKMRAIAEEASALVRAYKGAYSGEHGDGLVRSEWVAWQFGPKLVRAFEEIKGLFDPDGLMNPGKIVRPRPMDDRTLFRYPPGYRTLPMETGLDWSAWNVHGDPVTDTLTPPGSGGDPAGGFAKAVEMCNNNGHCRKFDAGTMCPSYRATRDEQHVTRGRANTLRLALSGQLGADFASPAVRDALDLCVGCKGCRRECPTGVDMAKIKIEFMHQWQRAHGLTLKARAIAFLPRWAPWAARLPWLANLRETLPGVARWSEGWTGLSAKRALPRWRRDTFARSRRGHVADSGSADVILFVDTFTQYFEPENAQAAVRRADGGRLPRGDRGGGRGRCRRRAAAVLRPDVPGRRARRRSQARGAPHGRGTRAARGARRRHRRPGAVLPADAARRVPRAGVGRVRADAGGPDVPVRGVPRARVARRQARASARPAAGDARAAARPLPPEGVRCGGARAGRPEAGPRAGGRAGRVELLRHGGQLRLRGVALRRLDADGRAVAAPRRARRRAGHADRGRRHELPAPDRGRHAGRPGARAGPRGARARPRAAASRAYVVTAARLASLAAATSAARPERVRTGGALPRRASE